MRARNIKPSFFRNELLAEVTPDVRLLFIGLWCMADREGRVENRPTRIKLEIAPLDSINVASAIKELEEKGFIKTYVADEKSVIQIINFLKHQNPHSTERDSLLPDESGSYVVNKRNNNKSITGEYELKNSPLTVKRQLINSSDEVKKLSHNALNPESLILNPESNKKPLSASADVVAVFDYWKSVMDSPKSKLDEKRKNFISKALNGYSVEDLKKAVDGCKASEWHMGKNDRSTKFNGVDLIFRDAEKIDFFMGKVSAEPVNEHIIRMRRDGLLPQEAA